MKTASGAAGASVELPDEIFGIEPNVAVMHQVVTAQLAAKRAGTHSTKTRAEVRGGGAKPWRQKGTGRARQGSIRRAAVARRRRGPWPAPARLLAADAQEDGAARAPQRALRPGEREQGHRRRRLGHHRAEHEGGREAARGARPAQHPEAGGRRAGRGREAPDQPRRLRPQPARARRVVPHGRGRVEVAAQPRRAGPDPPPRGAQHLRRAAQRLDRVLAGVARGDHRPPLRPGRRAERGAADEPNEVEAP